jgi:hypothetical protein
MNDDTLKAARSFFARNDYMDFYSDMANYGRRNAIADIEQIMADFCDSRTAELRRQLEVARAGLEKIHSMAATGNWAYNESEKALEALKEMV